MIKVSDIADDQIVFYDIETTDQFAPYTELRMIGVKYGWTEPAQLVETWGEKRRFRETLADPDILKVQFNGCNFDDLVLYRHGFPVNERNRHDLFLMAKTCAPRLPAYSLKFINWYYFGDFHPPEQQIEQWLRYNNQNSLWQAPADLLRDYCLYDVHPQTTNVFKLFWEVVQRPLHWEAYTNVELPMGLPMEEIMLRGGEYLDKEQIKKEIATLQDRKDYWEDVAYRESNGKIDNPNSVKQVGSYLRDEEGIELELTDKGNFSLKKADVLDFLDLDDSNRDRSKIIRALFEVRRINNALSYYRNYEAALGHSADHSTRKWIPKQYSLSGARTRRILSNSKYKLNFQNPSEEAEKVQVVPPGWLGWWIDATQIENVVHIYESGDTGRRKAYEEDPDWNEYVWLCNMALGGSRDKKELDGIPSPINPAWSVYKQFKTTKLAINFGMGVPKYCKTAKLPERAGRASYAQLHRVCPAIRALQNRVASDLATYGYVQDVFGHIYSGNVRIAYKVMAYLIQGCGTGSLPKVQMRANYETLHQWDEQIDERKYRSGQYPPWSVIDEQRMIISYAVLSGTTHDENSGRISLALEDDQIIATLQQLYYNMTERFSHRFDNIPLRAKLYLSRTTTAEKEEVNPFDIEHIRKFLCPKSDSSKSVSIVSKPSPPPKEKVKTSSVNGKKPKARKTTKASKQRSINSAGSSSTEQMNLLT